MEVVETERSYADSLATMMQMYYWPLMSLMKQSLPGTILTETESQPGCPSFTGRYGRILFGNIDQILHVSQQFLQKLEQGGLSKILSGETLSAHFSDIIPLLKVYLDYCLNFHNAQAVLTSLLTHTRHQDFQKFLGQCGAPLALDSYLIMPVQRIPRYKLLLTELVRLCEARYYNCFDIALKKISGVATKINQEMAERQNSLALMHLSREFVGDDPNFFKTDRVLIKRENLTKRCRGNVKKLVHVMLFNDCFAYASGLMGKYILRKKIPIDDSFRVSDAKHDQDKETLMVLNAHKSITLEFTSLQQRIEWLTALEACIKNLSHSGSAAWPGAIALKPKSSGQYCGLCKSKFSLLKTCRNCRVCGELFCDDCTRSRVPFPCDANGELTVQLKRVCNACSDMLLDESMRDLLRLPQHVEHSLPSSSSTTSDAARKNCPLTPSSSSSRLQVAPIFLVHSGDSNLQLVTSASKPVELQMASMLSSPVPAASNPGTSCFFSASSPPSQIYCFESKTPSPLLPPPGKSNVPSDKGSRRNKSFFASTPACSKAVSPFVFQPKALPQHPQSPKTLPLFSSSGQSFADAQKDSLQNDGKFKLPNKNINHGLW